MKDRIESLRRAVQYGLDNGKKNMIVELDLLTEILSDAQLLLIALEGNLRLRTALLPFAAAAGRPGRLTDPMTGNPLPDDVVLGLGVRVSAWKLADELTGTD